MEFDAAHPVNVLLVDDNLLYRSSLELIVQRLLPDALITHAHSREVAARALADEPGPALVVADLDALPAPHWHRLAALRAAYPQAPIVALGDDDDPQSVRHAIDCGAMSYLTKADTPDSLSEALDRVLQGGATLPAVALSIDGSPTAGLRCALLSGPDREVLRATLHGCRHAAIARAWATGEAAVRAHARTLLQTLGLPGRSALVYAVAKAGLRWGPLYAQEAAASYSRNDALRSCTLSAASKRVGNHSFALNSTSYA